MELQTPHNTKKKMIKGKPKVDSCRLSIPLIDCQIIDTNLIDQIETQTINTETGEVIKSKISNGTPTVIENEDGTYLKFWKENQFFYENGIRIPTIYITFLVNSKHLGKDYFKGITQETLPKIHRYIESFNIVSFPYETLLKARYNDTDICIDFNSTKSEFEALKSNVKSLSIKPDLWYTANQKNNSGIWTPTKDKPRDNAKPTTPFIKFYSKEEDFKFQSITFANAYLQEQAYKNVYRLEATIKNSEHKKRLGINKQNEFGQFLKLDLQLLLQQIVKEYFENTTKLILKNNDLTPVDKVMIDLINKLILSGATNKELYSVFNRKDVSRQAKNNLIGRYHKYTMTDDFNRERLELNSTTNELFSYLDIDIKN